MINYYETDDLISERVSLAAEFLIKTERELNTPAEFDLIISHAYQNMSNLK